MSQLETKIEDEADSGNTSDFFKWRARISKYLGENWVLHTSFLQASASGTAEVFSPSNDKYDYDSSFFFGEASFLYSPSKGRENSLVPSFSWLLGYRYTEYKTPVNLTRFQSISTDNPAIDTTFKAHNLIVGLVDASYFGVVPREGWRVFLEIIGGMGSGEVENDLIGKLDGQVSFSFELLTGVAFSLGEKGGCRLGIRYLDQSIKAEKDQYSIYNMNTYSGVFLSYFYQF